MAARNGPALRRPIRDQRLLDALTRDPYGGTVWNSVREGRDPSACWRSGGRWDDGTLDVLYTPGKTVPEPGGKRNLTRRRQGGR